MINTIKNALRSKHHFSSVPASQIKDRKGQVNPGLEMQAVSIPFAPSDLLRNHCDGKNYLRSSEMAQAMVKACRGDACELSKLQMSAQKTMMHYGKRPDSLKFAYAQELSREIDQLTQKSLEPAATEPKTAWRETLKGSQRILNHPIGGNRLYIADIPFVRDTLCMMRASTVG